MKKTRSQCLHKRNIRRGSIVLLAAVMLVVMVGFMALAVDLGYMYTARTQLQRTADAAAIAGAWELIAEEERVAGDNLSNAVYQARVLADQYAAKNRVGTVAPSLAESDVTIGYRSNIFDRGEPISLLGSNLSNTVHVKVRRTSQQNGEVPLFFARVMGYNSAALEADATAALLTSIKGFTAPSDGGNLELLPFALDQETAQDLCDGCATDDWRWDFDTCAISAGPDGVPEVNLFPQGTGSPGNRGTVDVGSSNNSTADISRQIMDGISKDDLDHHGGSLEFDQYGELSLNADTGISAGFKDELAAIKGEPRIIPIFESISGNGNNANYTIVGWMGVRILDVKLTGPMSKKHVTIQPACIKVRGAIPADPGTQPSNFIFSPVVLVE